MTLPDDAATLRCVEDTTAYKVRMADGTEFGPATIDVLERWAREGRVPANAYLIAPDGTARAVADDPTLAPIASAPPTMPGAPQPAEGGVVIPYRNPPALIAYYLGIFALIPFLGLFLAIPAFILGIIGLRARAKDPSCHGAVHAWIGIVAGLLFTLLWGGLLIVSIIGAARF